jgi:hypothetical protein
VLVPKPGEAYVAVQGLSVTFEFSEALVISSGSPSWSVQLNGFAQKGDNTICWQQYGFQLSSDNNGNNTLVQAYAESWPESLNSNPKAQNVYNLLFSDTVTVPANTVPAGRKVTMDFEQQTDGTISGLVCNVYDENGDKQGSLNQPLLGQPLAAGGTIQQSDLAKLIAYHVVLVGIGNYADCNFSSGSGQIIYESSNPITTINYWPPDSDGDNGTGESANTSYGLMPAQSDVALTSPSGSRSETGSLGPSGPRVRRRARMCPPRTAALTRLLDDQPQRGRCHLAVSSSVRLAGVS